MKGVSLRLILEDKGKGGYQFVGSNLGVEILSETRGHHKKGVLKQKIEVFLYTLYWDFKIIPFTLCTYVLAKILQNGANFIQKADSWLKNQMRNLDNFREAVVDSPKG